MQCELALSPKIQNMQQIARRHSQLLIGENQKVCSELESKMQNLELKSRHLDELAVRTNLDRMNLQKEKEHVCFHCHTNNNSGRYRFLCPFLLFLLEDG